MARRAVAEAGLTLTPDPLPEEVVFVRSDQYPFVREGVPAIYLKSGIKPRDGGDGLQRWSRSSARTATTCRATT